MGEAGDFKGLRDPPQALSFKEAGLFFWPHATGYILGLAAPTRCLVQRAGACHLHRVRARGAGTHPLTGKEIRAVRQLRRENLQSRYVFNAERGGPVTRAWFLKMIRRTGELGKLPFPVHPHMLRHACGFKLANVGHDTRALQHYLGHKKI